MGRRKASWEERRRGIDLEGVACGTSTAAVVTGLEIWNEDSCGLAEAAEARELRLSQRSRLRDVDLGLRRGERCCCGSLV